MPRRAAPKPAASRPKAKPKPAPKRPAGKAAAPRKQFAGAKRQEPDPDAEQEEEQEENTETPSKRRQPNRRDTDEMVDRNVTKKLSHIPECVWRNKIGKTTNLKIVDFVKREAKPIWAEGGRVSTKVWMKVFREFDLAESAADSLEDPPEDLPVAKDLVMALSAACTGNPAGTPSAPLERYLETCPALNRAEMFGLFGACMKSPAMPRNVAIKCQVAILRYIARTYGFNKLVVFITSPPRPWCV